MGRVNFGQTGAWWPAIDAHWASPLPYNTGNTQLAMSASTHRVNIGTFRITPQMAAVGSITAITFLNWSYAATNTVSILLETTNATTHNPTGSAYGGCVAWTGTPTSGVEGTATFATPATGLVVGDEVAVVARFSAYTSGSSPFSARTIGFYSGYPFCGSSTDSGTTWTRMYTGVPVLGVKCSDGAFYWIGPLPEATRSNSTFTSSSTPDEMGLYFIAPANFSSSRFYAQMAANTGASSQMIIKLYDATTLSALSLITGSTVVLDGAGFALQGTTPLHIEMPFTASLDIKKGKSYFLGLSNGSASVNCYLSFFTVGAAANMGAMSGGLSAYWGERTDAGTLSVTTTKRPYMGVGVDKIIGAAFSPRFAR